MEVLNLEWIGGERILGAFGEGSVAGRRGYG